MRSHLPRLNLTEYRALVGALPPPNYDQIEAFTAYVAESHSWYKHLPLWPPGLPFLFFINPYAGLDCIVNSNDETTYFPRTKDNLHYHYSWITTKTYRARYGWLDCTCDAGSGVMLPVTAQQDGKQAAVPAISIYKDFFRLIRVTFQKNPFKNHTPTRTHLPPELIEAGTVNVAGLIHTRTDEPWPWLILLKRKNNDPNKKYPPLLREILNRCEYLHKQNKYLNEPDQVLHDLVELERVRQKAEIISAIQAVIELIYSNKPSKK